MAVRSTGIKGLDKLLGGGISPGKVLLLLSPPGAGKTTFCRKFAMATSKRKERIIYISTGAPFEECKKALEKAGAKFDARHCSFIDCFSWRKPGENPPPQAGVTVMGSISDLNELARQISQRAREMGGVDAIVLDSISDLVLYSSPTSVYKFLQILHGEITKNNASGMVALEFGLHEAQVTNTINYIFDGMARMKMTDEGRQLRVERLAGHTHSLEWANYKIGENLEVTFEGE